MAQQKKSTYQRKKEAGLVPSRYSGEYHAWRDAVARRSGVELAHRNWMAKHCTNTGARRMFLRAV